MATKEMKEKGMQVVNAMNEIIKNLQYEVDAAEADVKAGRINWGYVAWLAKGGNLMADAAEYFSDDEQCMDACEKANALREKTNGLRVGP